MGKVGTEATLQEIKGLVEVLAKGTTTETLAGFKTLVRNGTASSSFPVGTQLVEKWAQAQDTEYDAPWDIAHYDSSGNAYLNWHFCLPDGVQFDAPEAIYYAPSGGLAAGTYHIPIGTAYGTGWDTAKAIQLTLNNAMDEGDQLVIDMGQDNKNDPTNGRTWDVYAKGSTTSKDTGTTSNGTGGTSLGTIGATNAHKPEGNLNGISRIVYGYARWSQSAMRQYLNSSAAANAWWTPQNDWDRPPAQHTTMRGFLAGYADSFVSQLDTVDVVTALNTVEGHASTSETTQDKIFLPSLQEMYINPQLANVEGVDWDYNKALAQQAGLPGKFQQSQTYEILKKYRLDDKTSSAGVFLRSCDRSYANTEWFISNSGYVYGNYAYSAYRGCPACKILRSA